MIEELFGKLGYSPNETKIYSRLVECDKATASDLSKNTKIPRATVYTVLDSLIERGVVTHEKSGGKSFFVAAPPSALSREVEIQREVLDERSKIAKDLAKALTPHFRKVEHSIPRLNFVEGKRNIETLLYEYLPEWRRSTGEVGDFTLWGYQDHTFVEEYRRWHDHLWRTRSTKEKIYLFSNASNIEKELLHKVPMREVRALPEGTLFRSSIWLYGDYILIAMTRERPHFAIHIKNDIFAANLRAIFQLLWRARF